MACDHALGLVKKHVHPAGLTKAIPPDVDGILSRIHPYPGIPNDSSVEFHETGCDRLSRDAPRRQAKAGQHAIKRHFTLGSHIRTILGYALQRSQEPAKSNQHSAIRLQPSAETLNDCVLKADG